MFFKHSSKEPKNMLIQCSNKECQCLCSVCILNSAVHTITYAVKRRERDKRKCKGQKARVDDQMNK